MTVPLGIGVLDVYLWVYFIAGVIGHSYDSDSECMVIQQLNCR